MQIQGYCESTSLPRVFFYGDCAWPAPLVPYTMTVAVCKTQV